MYVVAYSCIDDGVAISGWPVAAVLYASCQSRSVLRSDRSSFTDVK